MELQAKWIWAESHLGTPNCYVYTRKEFEAVGAPSAEASVACTGEYKLYVNGRYVGRGANYGHSQDTHDLSHVIRPGKNVIAAICHSPGREGHDTEPRRFLLQLEFTRNGEHEQLISTDETWKTKSADEWDFNSTPIHAPERYQEVYDSRAKPVGWNVVGFDDSAWPQPAIADGVGTDLPPRQIPPLREHEVHPKHVVECGSITPNGDPSLDIATRMYTEQTHPDQGLIKYTREMLSASGDAAVVNPGPDSYVVLDFGAELVGYPSLKVRGSGQAIVEIGYSEVLDQSGRVWLTRGGILQADRLILHGGRQDWQAFGRRVFRYMQLTFRNVGSPILVESVSAVAVGYPVEQASTFECSDELLNEIWRTGVHTLSLCMQDKYESGAGSPNQNVADAQLQALFNCYCFFDSALAAQALEQTFDNALDESTGLAWANMLHDYFLHTADVGLVQQLYPSLSKLLNHPLFVRPNNMGCCAYRHQVLRNASKLAAAVSNTEDALRWHDEADALRRTFNQRFWDEKEHLYSDDREWIDGEQSSLNLLAIACGLVDSHRSYAMWNRLCDMRLEVCGLPYDLFFVLQGLAKLEKTREALDLIRRVWGGMLQRGATTWWASLPIDDDEISEDELCCGSSGAPTYFLPAEVLGVKPSTAGGAVVIQPRVGDLRWAKGHIKTMAGYVDVEWSTEDGVFRIDIEAPLGFIIALPTSGFTDPVIDEFDLTPETPERRARKTYGWGSTIWRAGEEHDPYLDWLATQDARPPDSYDAKQRCSAEECYVWVRESVSNHVRYEVHDG